MDNPLNDYEHLRPQKPQNVRPRSSLKTGGEKRNRFGRVFKFKSTVFGRFETATRPRYAPRKLGSRVALLEKVH